MTSPPPPVADFSIAVSPNSTSSVVGGVTMPVTISVTPQNGFSGTVNVTLQGVPQGISVSPAAPLSIAAGGSQNITFTIADSATVGMSSISLLGTSGALSHSAQLSLTAEAMVQTYQNGSVLYLESRTATDIARIGLETTWGGSIVEVSVNGTEFVNRHDTGREVQVSYRDGNDHNWNPTLGGDSYDQGTPTQAFSFDTTSLYTKAIPIQWSPDYYGGGSGHPIPGDILVEQTITAVTSQPHTFKAHFKVTHLGNDLHANTEQEYPAVYTNKAYSQFVYYGGPAPWSNGAVTATQFPNLPQAIGQLYGPEHWGALVDAQNTGLTVYVPSQFPYFNGFSAVDPTGPGGPADDSTNYFALHPYWTIGPGFSFQGDIYVIAGDYTTARQIIYQLHQSISEPDISSPIGFIDAPSTGATVTGVLTVSGWTFDDVSVSKVEVLVDGTADGVASYGSPRPDIPAAYPQAPTNVGYSYSLDTSKYANGIHTLNVRVTDGSGNVAILPQVVVLVNN